MRGFILGLGVAAFLVGAFGVPSEASAQQVLDRLERILRDEVLPRIQQPAPAAPRESFYAPSAVPLPAQPAADARVPTEQGYAGLVADDRDTRGRGVQVTSIRERGPAALAGLQAGDVILAMRGQAVRTLDEFAAALAGQPEGTAIEVIFQRGMQNFSTTITLGPKPLGAIDPPAVAGNPPPATSPSLPTTPATPAYPNTPAQLGVRVVTVTEAARLGHAVFVRSGAVITSVEVDSPAARAGLPSGSVVVAVDGQRVNDPVDLATLIQTARWGRTVELLLYRGQQLYRLRVPLIPTGYAERAAPDVATDPPLVLKPKITEFPPRATPATPAPAGPLLPTAPTDDPELVPPIPMPPAAAPGAAAPGNDPRKIAPPGELSELELRLGVKAPAAPVPPGPAPAPMLPAGSEFPDAPVPPIAPAVPAAPAADDVAKLRAQMTMIRDEAARLRDESQKLERVLAELQSRLDKLEAAAPKPMKELK